MFYCQPHQIKLIYRVVINRLSRVWHEHRMTWLLKNSRTLLITNFQVSLLYTKLLLWTTWKYIKWGLNQKQSGCLTVLHYSSNRNPCTRVRYQHLKMDYVSQNINEVFNVKMGLKWVKLRLKKQQKNNPKY